MAPKSTTAKPVPKRHRRESQDLPPDWWNQEGLRFYPKDHPMAGKVIQSSLAKVSEANGGSPGSSKDAERPAKGPPKFSQPNVRPGHLLGLGSRSVQSLQEQKLRKKQQQEEQNQERIQAEAFRSSFKSKQAQADKSKAAKQDENEDTLLFPIPKPKAMQTRRPSTVPEETAFQAVQRNMEACKRKLQAEILLSSEEEESAEKKKVDRSTLQDFCKDMSDEDILSNRELVPTWGYTKEAARKLFKAKQEKNKDLTTEPTGV